MDLLLRRLTLAVVEEGLEEVRQWGEESGGLEAPRVPGQSTVGWWCEAGVGEEETGIQFCSRWVE